MMSRFFTVPWFRYLPLLLLGLMLVAPLEAMASGGGGSGSACAAPAPNTPTCTNHPFFDATSPCYFGKSLTGVLQKIVDRVQTAVNGASQAIFDSITLDYGFNVIVSAAMTLMVAFFAVAFMFGFVQLTLGQGIIRLVKIGFLVWLITPGLGWLFIEDYVKYFFDDGTNCMIGAMINIAQSGSAGSGFCTFTTPFSILEGTVQLVFSPRMFVTAVASFTTPPYGVAVGLALIWAIIEFVMALMRALMIYALSLIVKALLYGLAPIFFVFLLFDKTKQYFMGWINQLVSFSLQPILMFAFLAFFASLINSSASAILARPDTHVCYTNSRQQGTTPFSMENWEFICPDGTTIKPYSGQRTATGALECPTGRIFPVSVVDILVFMLIVHIASSVMKIIPALASEMSQTVTRLDEALQGMNMFGAGGGRGSSAISRAELNRPRT